MSAKLRISESDVRWIVVRRGFYVGEIFKAQAKGQSRKDVIDQLTKSLEFDCAHAPYVYRHEGHTWVLVAHGGGWVYWPPGGGMVLLSPELPRQQAIENMVAHADGREPVDVSLCS